MKQWCILTIATVDGRYGRTPASIDRLYRWFIMVYPCHIPVHSYVKLPASLRGFSKITDDLEAVNHGES